jgi:hypothetical protein
MSGKHMSISSRNMNIRDENVHILGTNINSQEGMSLLLGTPIYQIGII